MPNNDAIQQFWTKFFWKDLGLKSEAFYFNLAWFEKIGWEG